MNKNEAFARAVVDAQLAAFGSDTQDTNAVRYEVVLDGGKVHAAFDALLSGAFSD